MNQAINHPITVLILNDHTLIRETWSKMIDENVEFHVVATCGDIEQAIDAAKTLLPKVVLMDMSRKGLNGVEATRKILSVLPGLQILSISQQDQSAYVAKVLKAGSIGYLTRHVAVDELFQALKEVANGKRYLSHEVLLRLSEELTNDDNPAKLLQSLSAREKEIVDLIAKGYTSKQIANALFLAEGTIQVHRHNIYKKLKVTKTAKLLNLVNDYQDVA